MYNVRKPTTMEDLKRRGGIVTTSQMKVGNEKESKEIPEELKKPIRVYGGSARRGMMLGPIGRKPANYSLYDLMTNDEDMELRKDGFEDWMFPDFKTVREGDGDHFVTYMQPCKTLWRGGRDMITGVGSSITPNSAVQYVYVLLNPMKSLISTFGDHKGMVPQKSHYLVCIEVGDPRTGRLDNAFIQYALNLNTSVHSCVELLTTESYEDLSQPNGKGYQYLYKINGNPELEKELFDRWFNGDDYYFNSVLYPRIRMMDML